MSSTDMNQVWKTPPPSFHNGPRTRRMACLQRAYSQLWVTRVVVAMGPWNVSGVTVNRR